MAIEDFEWEAAVRDELAAPRRSKVWEWLKQTVWLEPALKLGGMAALLGVLAGIGVVATTYAKPGVPLPEVPRAVVGALGTSWLKPAPAGSDHAVRTAPAPGPAPSAAPTPTGSPASSAPPEEAESRPPAAAGLTPDGKVILNSASAEELTKLPGVGMKRAQAIVALRTKLKRFKSATELLRVKGIGPRGLQRMLPHLVLDGPQVSS